MRYFKDIYIAGRLCRKHRVPKKLWWSWQKAHLAVGWRITYKTLFIMPLMVLLLPFAVIAQVVSNVVEWLKDLDCMYVYNEKTARMEDKVREHKNKLWEHIPQTEMKSHERLNK